MKIIVVTGLPGSGKSEVCNTLSSRIPVVKIGKAIKDEVKKRGMRLTIETSEMMARKLREELGLDAPVKLIKDKLEEFSKKEDLIVVDGLRNIEEVDYLKQFGEIIILVAEAPKEIRLKRLLGRGDERDPSNDEQFKQRERGELERGLDKLMKTDKYPRHVIENKGTIKELKEKVEKLFNKIINNHRKPP